MILKRILVAALALAPVGGTASALPVQLDENVFPVNPENGFGAFTFGAFSVPGAFTDGPTSLILDVEGTGGAGVDFGPWNGSMLVPIDFGPAGAEWELRIMILPENGAAAIWAVYKDVDDPAQTTGEEFVYQFDLTGIPNDGAFHVLTRSLSEVLLSRGSTGLLPGDSLQNPGLTRLQIESPSTAGKRLHVEIDYLRIRSVPEPAAWGMAGLGALGVGARRRRR